MKRETSTEVYHQIAAEGLLSKRRFQVYDTLFNRGPLTQMETSRLIPEALDHSISPRFAELENLGVVKSVGERVCKITGRNVMIWDVTAHLPVKTKKTKPTIFKCQHCKGTGKITQENLF